VLNPLTEVCIGVLMPIHVSRRQFVVYILRDSKGRESKEDTDNPQCHSRTEQTKEARE